MSRSRKAPYWTEGYGSKNRRIQKRHANKRVRAAKFESQSEMKGGLFKRLKNSWDIVDFSFVDKKNPKARRK
jgi:hypothetical protein